MSATPYAQPLPTLRPDVEFLRGPDEHDGAPTFVLHDPLRGTFDKLTWAQAEVVRRLRRPIGIDWLLEELRRMTTLHTCADDVLRLCVNVQQRGLTSDQRVTEDSPWTQPAGRRAPRNVADLFRYLVFMRIALLHPDAFLTATVGWARLLVHPVLLMLYAVCALLGLVGLVQRFDAYFATFPYFFNWWGALAFAGTIAAVKSVHEFSHAYVAKAFGNRVPTMGVALIFLFPVAYADVTDSWRMRSRRQRLLIALAGVLAELVIAGLALFGWMLSPPGLFHGLCFVLSSVTILSTVMVNLNPAMRFDGYYVLGDLLGIDNLQPRAFAATRWALRRHVLGLPVTPSEPGLTSRLLSTLLLYTLGAWTYRLVLYFGIALMLYHRVTKVLGALLFVVALYTFLIRPVVTEMHAILRLRKFLWHSARAWAVALVAVALLTWAVMPASQRVAVPAVSRAGENQSVYAPGEGVLRELHAERGRPVRAGQTLFVLESTELNALAELARLEAARVDLELALLRTERGNRALLPQKLEEQTRAIARLEAVRTAIDRNRAVAAIDGVVVEWDESVRDGTPIGSEQVLGRVMDPGSLQLVAFVRHHLLDSVAVGDQVEFISDAQPGVATGRVTFVDPVRTQFLDHRGLASLEGGDIAVIPDAAGRLEMIESYYAVEVTLDEPPVDLRIGQTGRVWLRTAPRSRLLEVVAYLKRILLRESGL